MLDKIDKKEPIIFEVKDVDITGNFNDLFKKYRGRLGDFIIGNPAQAAKVKTEKSFKKLPEVHVVIKNSPGFIHFMDAPKNIKSISFEYSSNYDPLHDEANPMRAIMVKKETIRLFYRVVEQFNTMMRDTDGHIKATIGEKRLDFKICWSVEKEKSKVFIYDEDEYHKVIPFSYPKSASLYEEKTFPEAAGNALELVKE